MFTKQIWINPELYPYLTRWGLSMGYEVITNDAHTLLLGLRCIDPIRIRELKAINVETSLSEEEAENLVADLAFKYKIALAYEPAYHPLIQMDEDMYGDHFLPYVEEAGWNLHAEHRGVFWFIHTVSRSDYDPANWQEGGVFCRSQVTGMIRDLEYDRRMSPYLVAYNVLKARGVITKTWVNGLESLEKAMTVVEREKPRNRSTAHWRIYRDLTPIVRHMIDDFPDDVLKPDGYLWLRIWHPGEYGGDYWSCGLFDKLTDVRVALMEEETLDMYSVTAIYACVFSGIVTHGKED